MKKILILLLVTIGCSLQAQAQVAVIAHPAVAEAAVDANTVLDIYTLDQSKWSDGTRIVPIALDDATAGAFYGALGRSHSNLKKVWLRKKLSGEGQPPEALSSPEAVIAKVASTPGAVGFVPADAADGSVKVVATL